MLENHKNLSRVIGVEFEILIGVFPKAETSPLDPICSKELPPDFGLDSEMLACNKTCYSIHVMMVAKMEK
jgi:hypothetical protein